MAVLYPPSSVKKIVSLSHVRAVQVTGTKHVGVLNRVIKQHLLSTPSSGLIHSVAFLFHVLR